MDENLEKENVFVPTEEVKLPDMIVLQPFVKTFYFNYSGLGDVVIAKLSGRPSTTGIKADSVVHEADGAYSVRLSGAPREINKNDFILRLTDNKNHKTEFPITFNVTGIEIQKTKLPDAVGLFQEYSAKIAFTNPTNIQPKFSYNFPVDFGRVFTEDEDGPDYTTIRFYPTRAGDYKFIMQALCEADDNEPEGKEVVLGTRTLHMKVIDTSPQPKPGKLESVQSVDIKDWK